MADKNEELVLSIRGMSKSFGRNRGKKLSGILITSAHGQLITKKVKAR